eukprot:Hpha_TRINITY_DN1967_c0_g1::TRINITY_DN1967_c0_g1_i1::g.31054::m.31054
MRRDGGEVLSFCFGDAGTISVEQLDTSDTGGSCWPSALALSNALAQGECGQVRGRRVLELGSGTGLVGLVAARLGAQVCLTDLESEELQKLAQRNVDRNDVGGSCEVSPLVWGRVPDALDMGARWKPD